METWKREYDHLATYNSEISRGIMHTPDYDKRMKILQVEYNRDFLRLTPEKCDKCGQSIRLYICENLDTKWCNHGCRGGNRNHTVPHEHTAECDMSDDCPGKCIPYKED